MVLGDVALAAELQLVGADGQRLRLAEVDGVAAVVGGPDVAGTGVDVEPARMLDGGVGTDGVPLAGPDGERGHGGVAVGLAGLHGVAALAQLRLPQAGPHVLPVIIDVGTVVHRHLHVAVQVAHVLHLHLNQADVRCLTRGDGGRRLALEAVLRGTDGMAAVAQVLADGRLAARLAVDEHLGLGDSGRDGGVAARADVHQQLVGLAALDGNGVEVVAQHTVVLVLDDELLGTAGHVEPDLAHMLLGGHDALHAAVEGEATLGCLDLDECGLLAVLVGLLRATGVGCQVILQQPECDDSHLRHGLHNYGETQQQCQG